MTTGHNNPKLFDWDDGGDLKDYLLAPKNVCVRWIKRQLTDEKKNFALLACSVQANVRTTHKADWLLRHSHP
jgi:hypothetical protein